MKPEHFFANRVHDGTMTREAVHRFKRMRPYLNMNMAGRVAKLSLMLRRAAMPGMEIGFIFHQKVIRREHCLQFGLYGRQNSHNRLILPLFLLCVEPLTCILS